jgi:phage FluMu protein Com
MTVVRCPAVLTTKTGFEHVCKRKLAEDLTGVLRVKCPRCKNTVTIDSAGKPMV